MEHFLCHSVYQEVDGVFGPDPLGTMHGIGCDGLELLTGYSAVPGEYRPLAGAVHLPYAADWHRAWVGKKIPDTDEDTARYLMYGKNADDIIKNLALAISVASELNPPYGVLHAGNISLDDITMRRHKDGDREILTDFCEMVNAAVAGFPGGRPPFTLALENLWWPGLRMTEGWEVGFFEKKLEFENWAICLDTGHLLNCLPDIRTEEGAVESLLKAFDRYGNGTKDRIRVMHLHMSLSSDYRETFAEREWDRSESLQENMARAGKHIGKIDRHLPFSIPSCAELVDALSPEYVTHEMIGAVSCDILGDFRKQRSFFP